MGVNNMTKSQMKWAKQHDWFITARCRKGVYSVTVSETEESTVIKFTCFTALKIWAGY